MDFDRLNRKLEGLEKASTKGQKVKDLTALMRCYEIWQLAYANIYSNKGAMTEGIDNVTLDGMSSKRFQKLIAQIKSNKYKPKPVRRVMIPKKDGNSRPLGIPSGDDKLVQGVIKIILEQIFEPIFIDKSHGFRPRKSCHTALKQIKYGWKSMKWLVEFDIKGCFDNINHDILIYLLEKKIDDKRFINLIKSFLRAGYMEDWKHNLTYSGTPQGGILSPILSNIYLHELDLFVENLIERFNVGNLRPVNQEYTKLSTKIFKLRQRMIKKGLEEGDKTELKELQSLRREMPYTIENTSDYMRLVYCRYADDFICGVIGSFKQAMQIKDEISNFLKAYLELDVSPEKTKIVRATKGIEFLGYEVKVEWGERYRKVKQGKHFHLKRTINGNVLLRMPKHKAIEFCRKKEYGNYQSRKFMHRGMLFSCSNYEIVETYNAEFRGFANYYILAREIKRDVVRLALMFEGSLVKTLAVKNKVSVRTIYRRLKSKNELILEHEINGKAKKIRIFKPKHLEPHKEISGDVDRQSRLEYLYKQGTELTKRMKDSICEICGKAGYTEVHHVRKLKDLNKKRNLKNWERVMIARQRKTLVVCAENADSCHQLIHKGQLPDKRIIAVTA